MHLYTEMCTKERKFYLRGTILLHRVLADTIFSVIGKPKPQCMITDTFRRRLLVHNWTFFGCNLAEHTSQREARSVCHSYRASSVPDSLKRISIPTLPRIF